MTINCRYYVGIIRYEIHEISYNIQIYSQLTEQGKEISILHEYMHPTLFFQGKPHDHNAFINDSVWQQGIRDIFPGKSNDFYNAMQYYGCEDVLNEMVNSGKMTESEKSRIKGIIQSHLLQ